jgi:acetyl-CoA carboxylase biotin carboxyl carrier protein
MATEVPAHITGTVWKIERQVGDAVSEGDTIVILESMKMEMPVEAPSGGTISEIRVQEGSPVNEGDVIAVIA